MVHPEGNRRRGVALAAAALLLLIFTEFDAVHSVERARDVGSLERIIEPGDMRETLISELQSMLDQVVDPVS